jgi:BMFP domain-containing protein YqiC
MANDRQTLLDDLQARVGDLLRSGPAGDIERNMKALLAQTFQRLDLVTREEFDTQVALLDKLRARVAELEHALRALEDKGRDEAG